MRRRLLVISAPVVLLLLLASAKLISLVIAGDAAVPAYQQRDGNSLRTAVNSLMVLNIVQPAKAHFNAGALAVADNRLDEADREFGEAVALSSPADSCASRINLELVRETLGDRAAAAFDGRTAISQYRRARTVAEQAPHGCFAGNTDPDPQRRAVREATLSRLDGKINAAQVAPPPPQPPPGVAASPSAPLPSGTAPVGGDTRLRLHPGAGPPLDRLQQILRDAASLGE